MDYDCYILDHRLVWMGTISNLTTRSFTMTTFYIGIISFVLILWLTAKLYKDDYGDFFKF